MRSVRASCTARWALRILVQSYIWHVWHFGVSSLNAWHLRIEAITIFAGTKTIRWTRNRCKFIISLYCTFHHSSFPVWKKKFHSPGCWHNRRVIGRLNIVHFTLRLDCGRRCEPSNHSRPARVSRYICHVTQLRATFWALDLTACKVRWDTSYGETRTRQPVCCLWYPDKIQTKCLVEEIQHFQRLPLQKVLVCQCASVRSWTSKSEVTRDLRKFSTGKRRPTKPTTAWRGMASAKRNKHYFPIKKRTWCNLTFHKKYLLAVLKFHEYVFRGVGNVV